MAGAIAAVLVLWAGLSFAFLFAGMEAGAFAVNRLRIRQLARAGNASARILNRFLESPEGFLWTILVGNTLATFTVTALAVHWLYGWLGERPWALAAVLLLVVLVIHATTDLLPKMIFRQSPNRLCLQLAGLFRGLHLLLTPLVAPLTWLAETLFRSTGGHRFTGRPFGNRAELRWLMQESGRGLTREERGMVNRVLELQNLTVGALARSLQKAVTVTAQTPIPEVFRLCREHEISRVPVREGSGGRIIGIITLRNSLYREDLDVGRTAGAFVQPALFLDESLRLEVALQRFRESGQRVAIVLDREQRDVGILAFGEILRFVFGEISL